MLTQVLEWIATVAFALYGTLSARRAGMDLVGTFAASFLTATGGGTLRDLLLDRRVFWLDSPWYVATALIIACLGVLLPRAVDRLIRFLPYPDALGLGLFAILGAQLARADDLPWLVAMIFGVITGCLGGVLTDVVCGEVPRIFRPAPLYATVAFLTAGLYLTLELVLDRPLVVTALCTSFALALRLLALSRELTLPNFASHADARD